MEMDILASESITLYNADTHVYSFYAPSFMNRDEFVRVFGEDACELTYGTLWYD